MHAARTTRSPLFLAPLTALALLLGGCSGSAESDETPAAEAADDAGDATEESRDKDRTSPDDASTTDAAASEGAACLEGAWLSEGESAEQSAVAGMAASGIEAEVSVVGGSVTTFSSGVWTQVFQDQVSDTAWSLEGQEIRSVTRYAGMVSGTYTATDEQVVIADVDTSALVLDQTTSINGEALDLPGTGDLAAELLEMGGTSTYTCAADELRITSLTMDGSPSGFTSVLSRQ